VGEEVNISWGVEVDGCGVDVETGGLDDEQSVMNADKTSNVRSHLIGFVA
jgi:hypothetical protein